MLLACSTAAVTVTARATREAQAAHAPQLEAEQAEQGITHILYSRTGICIQAGINFGELHCRK
jgi:hypothetical protein